MYKVLKFGGSSVATPERINNVIEIVKEIYSLHKEIAIVFSAFGGVTDVLIDMCNRACKGDITYIEVLKTFQKRHLDASHFLIKESYSENVVNTLRENHETLSDLLKGIFLVREVSPRTMDYVLSFGERNAAYIIAYAMKCAGLNADFSDARNILITDNSFGNAKVNFEKTNGLIQAQFKTFPESIQIVTGFIGSNAEGLTTTLGRGGSDYTASILAGALNAVALEIWTDVDGVLTCDPRKVKKAFTLENLTYAEAMEMSHFGAKVIYPPTIVPAYQKSIPIYIKNTFNPTFPGTLIHDNGKSVGNSPIKGVSSLNNIALLNLQGSGMIGIPGVASRLFNALSKEKINIILITQASSEYSICLAILHQDSAKAMLSIEEEFAKELETGLILPVKKEDNLSVIAVIGEGMRNVPGISGKLFSSLGKNGINVMAIAQGSSELNISFIVKQSDENKALNIIHDSFFLSDVKRVHLFVVGVGLIGKTLLQQIKKQQSFLHDELKLEFIVSGLANSKKMLLNREGISLDSWEDSLIQSEEKNDIPGFIEKMVSFNLPNSIFIDNTASDYIPGFYHRILSSSISISTPNKIAASSPLQNYLSLKQIAKVKNVNLMFETNVGAGLPVLSTLRNLVNSGDKLIKIEAVLSGSLSYIFNAFVPGIKFSELVKMAKNLGYTEPDPRDDLSGMDVKRKILILAREAGYEVGEKDVTITPFLPEKCFSAPNVDDFFNKLSEENQNFEQLITKTNKDGCYLRYIARFENNKIEIRLESVPGDSPFISLLGSDNMIVFTTERYKEQPLVIKGPGAGAEVTASGIFAELITSGLS
ncbi:MAG: bifunctional aspartate kinase/homoserine dehydrogenase I [Saprospiraceae bacterium]|nr:bifunctional aspartate kinase/homoserine dehydrogenase I [Saprospiraceae bacterium]MBK6564585.1 bifunctional aspartate kinase/homoserine dehydrogenase I [Saprospiraceae bacterium]MBK8371784.1 bifunctional aspartate kinase/homoserine dehydrogenase I [Saprospiraceae bacterium]MBK8819531.1 bifunctional aspartate kinase/homoserine dehydrogenase I [Saprospiraceae bacterium]MBK8853363.1 bifunctional aspartate kinase/homoserine dehydrogenase I [Saprospiraceae bacterium]